jgi:hypothetical protein
MAMSTEYNTEYYCTGGWSSAAHGMVAGKLTRAPLRLWEGGGKSRSGVDKRGGAALKTRRWPRRIDPEARSWRGDDGAGSVSTREIQKPMQRKRQAKSRLAAGERRNQHAWRPRQDEGRHVDAPPRVQCLQSPVC